MLIRSQGPEVLFFQDEWEDKISPDYFDGAYWQAKDAITGSAFGRGVTWFFELGAQEFVLRHYHRGGLVAKVNKDSYLYTGLKNTRAYQEFVVTQALADKSLPVPRPMAGRVIKRGLSYSADLITEKIAGARDLVAVLKAEPLGQEMYQNIGIMIRDFHQAGLWHADLNIHNIILDAQDKLWLIDFDRCEFRDKAESWQQDNLKRLRRSFLKEKNKHAVFHWQESEWELLLSGYKS